MINTEVPIFLHSYKIRYAHSTSKDISYGLHFKVYNTMVSKMDYQPSKLMLYFRFSTL